MLYIIMNPIAGKGLPLQYVDGVKALLDKYGRSYILCQTEYAGHATELAREAVIKNCDGLVVLGGDGTLSEVVSGLKPPMPPVYIVPSGSGNDLARLLKLPKSPLEALEKQLTSAPMVLDTALVNKTMFLNVLGTGFDIEVLRQTERCKARHSGSVAYLLGLIQAIRNYRPIEITLETDGETIRKNVTILVVANGQYIGGGMRVSPNSDPSDGWLDCIYVDQIKRWQICFLLPLFIPGSYVRLPIAHARRVRAVTVRSKGMTLDIDGNLVDADRAEIAICPASLQIGGYSPTTVSGSAAVGASSASSSVGKASASV